MRLLSNAGDPTSSPVAAKSDTSRSHLPSGMRIHADTVQVGARPIRAVVSVHPESFGNRPAYPDQSQRASASYVTMQTQSRIDAVAALVLPMHTRSRPGLQRRPRSRQDRTAATQLRAQLCIGLLWAKRRPASRYLSIPLYQPEGFDRREDLRCRPHRCSRTRTQIQHRTWLPLGCKRHDFLEHSPIRRKRRWHPYLQVRCPASPLN